MARTLSLPAGLCLWFLLVGAAQAVTFKPIKVELSPSGAGATATFVVQNNTAAPNAIQIFTAERAMDLDGLETNPEAEEFFLVYPSQMVLEPGEVRNVRVTWIGDPNPAKELAFRLICEQLPINLEVIQGDVGGQLRILVRYSASVYIVPKGATPDVVVESAAHQKAEGAPDELVVTLHNQGTAHTMLTGATLHVTSATANATVVLSEAQLAGLDGENILADSQRRFVMPWPQGLPVGEVHAQLTFD